MLDLSADHAKTLGLLASAAARLVRQGAEVLLLGCAGLTAFREELAAEVGAVVIDPVEAGCRMLRALVEGGLGTSRAGLYARPAAQRMHHLEDLFAPAMRRYLEGWESGSGE